VWWIGTRLVAERERACDEEVLRLGGEPQIYAEGILKVCELYLESPLQCVAGVTGSNLRERIRGIMTHPGPIRMSLAKKLLLVAAGMVAVSLPIVIGELHAQSAAAPGFDAASIRPCEGVMEPSNRGIGTEILLREGSAWAVISSWTTLLSGGSFGARISTTPTAVPTTIWNLTRLR